MLSRKRAVATQNLSSAGDVGCFCLFVMNLVQLAPGRLLGFNAVLPLTFTSTPQARPCFWGPICHTLTFLATAWSAWPARTMWCVEGAPAGRIPLTTFTQVRAGCTGKFKDVKNLVEMLTYEMASDRDQVRK